MPDPKRVVKALAGTQDFLLGDRIVEQSRNNTLVQVQGVSAQHLPFETESGVSIAQKIVTLDLKVETLESTITILENRIIALESA